MIRETGRYRNRTNFDGVLKDLSKIKGGVYLTVGYITGNAINKTLQNKDTEAFGKDIEQYQGKGTPGYDMLKQWQQGGASRANKAPVGIMKYTETTYHWQRPGTYGKKYGAYKDSVNKLLEPFGASLGSREKQQSQGDDKISSVDSHIYQNSATSSKLKEEYFMIKDGKIYGALNKNALRSLISKRSVDGVSALKKLGVQEDEIKKFIEQVKNLKYGSMPLVPDKILWISYTTADGIKKFAINHNFADNIDGIRINPNPFIERANKRYEKRFRAMPGYEDNNGPVVHSRQAEYTSESKKPKQLIKLTESDLDRIIKNSVKKYINEIKRF